MGIRRATGRPAFIERSKVLATLGFMRLVVRAALGIERFALAVEGGRDSLSQTSRLGQKIIEVPQSLSEHGRLQRIHGDPAFE